MTAYTRQPPKATARCRKFGCWQRIYWQSEYPGRDVNAIAKLGLAAHVRSKHPMLGSGPIGFINAKEVHKAPKGQVIPIAW